ncbi:hypothetical protein [Streptomyces barkulensis]|uniref:hypothetical protein n=1 Tax=Streptomyces barkulensis TaxID=1257026 RepID=UPI000C6D3DC4|nr:hypothetical protein [Streptomyces barkulensis]
MSVAGDGRDRFAAVVAWALLGVVLLAFTAFLGVRAAVGFGILGEGGHIVASRCVEQGGGRAGPDVECEGTLVNGDEKTSGQLVKVRLFSAEEGDTIPVHRAPWGTYEALDDSLFAKAGQGVFLALLTAAAVGCFVRAWSFVRRTAREPVRRVE